MVAGMGSYTILLNADTASFGPSAPTCAGVAGIADIAFLVIALTLGGISIGTQVLVARRFGEGRTERIGVITDNGMVAALAVGVVSTAFLLFFLPQLTALCFESPQLRALGEPFLQVKLYGLVIFLLMAPLRGFIVGIGETIHFLVASAIRAACDPSSTTH
ncbi:MAG: MATE family efflux transporter [Planctomycetota bacterium]|nr:MATE family efflux transporter [Planctomycetota bacterium]